MNSGYSGRGFKKVISGQRHHATINAKRPKLDAIDPTTIGWEEAGDGWRLGEHTLIRRGNWWIVDDKKTHTNESLVKFTEELKDEV